MTNTLRIASFNIHKGFSHFNAHFSLNQQREVLRNLHTDLVFLQEVQDAHTNHAKRFSVHSSQLEYLADSVWPQFAYGKNSIYPAGHHGNALLSKFPIIRHHNMDISAHRSEQRGMLHGEINIPDWPQSLHAICLHLGLFAHWRQQQLAKVAHYIEANVPADAPLIIAGDFNDWSLRAGQAFAKRLNLTEVFEHKTGKSARSFPVWLPVLRLDRMYVRGFAVEQVAVHGGAKLIKLSDHAVLSATLNRVSV